MPYLCKWCEGAHDPNSCPAVRRREFYPSGALRLVEFFDTGARRELPETISLDELRERGGQPQS